MQTNCSILGKSSHNIKRHNGTEETKTPLTDYTVADNKAYVLTKHFENSNSSKVKSMFNEYKNLLISNGFKFYKVSYDHYTYIKEDIAVELFEGVGFVSVNMSSGYQAPHID